MKKSKYQEKLAIGDEIDTFYSRMPVKCVVVGESENLYRLKVVECPFKKYIGLFIVRRKGDFSPVQPTEWI